MSAKKILIQHTTTKKYVKGAGTWTDEVNEALFFGTIASAVAYCKSCGLEEVRLVAKQSSAKD